MKRMQYKTMFGLIKKIVIELLADTVNVSNPQKSIFLSSHIRNVWVKLQKQMYGPY